MLPVLFSCVTTANGDPFDSKGRATGGKPEGLLRRLPGHARRLASKLGDLLTR
ncbi:MAG: hypothetical protein M3N33_03735 [Actinomycetota bacterium]|nr:hypothetical protein [Actinomycetota bacterium]